MEITAVMIFLLVAVTLVVLATAGILIHRSRKDAERLRRQGSGLTAQISRIERENEQKGEMLMRMSRRMGASANKMANVSRTAIRKIDDKEELRECLNELNASSQQLLEVANSVMEVSGLEEGRAVIKRDTFNFRTLVRSFELVFQDQTQKKGIQFEMAEDCDIDEPLVGDVLRVNQIIHNLMTNAIQYTEREGKIVLRIQKDGETDHSVRVRFSIIDTGCGIEEDDLEKIFIAFERLNNSVQKAGEGAGLGLYVAKRFTELMGGDMDVHSQVGIGSIFEVAIPFERAKGKTADIEMSALRDDGKKEAPVYDFKGRRILVAEDNELHMGIITELIEATGAACDKVINGSEAVEKYGEAPENYYDVILMDIAMPIMDGYEATRRIRKMERADSKTVPIFALTANTFEEDEIKSWDEGMNGHINKPISRDRIYFQLAKALDEK